MIVIIVNEKEVVVDKSEIPVISEKDGKIIITKDEDSLYLASHQRIFNNVARLVVDYKKILRSKSKNLEEIMIELRKIESGGLKVLFENIAKHYQNMTKKWATISASMDSFETSKEVVIVGTQTNTGYKKDLNLDDFDYEYNLLARQKSILDSFEQKEIVRLRVKELNPLGNVRNEYIVEDPKEEIIKLLEKDFDISIN